MHTIATPESLSVEGQAIVELAAKNRGVFEIATRADTRGPAIRAGHSKLYDPHDPDYAKRCRETVPELIELLLVKETRDRQHFELTNFGWQLSRRFCVKPTTGSEVAGGATICLQRDHEELAHNELTHDDTAHHSSDATPPSEPTPPTEQKAELPSSALWNTEAVSEKESLLSALGLEDSFRPEEPRTLKETGLNGAFVDDLILKVLLGAGSLSGRDIAEQLCLPKGVLEDRLDGLRQRQYLTPTGSALLGDHVYQLTDPGRERARLAAQECAYAGPAPVPLEDYLDSVQAQTIRSEKPKRAQLEKAFSDINVEPRMLAQLGPAISAGKGMFIYGPPGNGKTTVAQRITRCFGQNILIPHAIVEGGQIIKFYDASCHELVESKASSLLMTSDHDRRWIRIKRPTVVVGGELTMDSLELKHDLVSHVSEASLQLKSNCGSLLIDDFGRQRINPTELLNRWIIPLENRIDYLSLANGKKIEVPFEQLIIFSTNLEPHDLADDAFLRRIPFKIEIGAPSRDEFIKLFGIFAKKLEVDCPIESIEYLLAAHYDSCGRPFRRCQARDLLDQVAHFCEYNELQPVATPEILDHAVTNYFTAMAGGSAE